ncbi:hypothetical protein NL676_007141 [Syzygium grande]|nr:hypothetical protein NL676_007141 [Syzygium grande]
MGELKGLSRWRSHYLGIGLDETPVDNASRKGWNAAWQVEGFMRVLSSVVQPVLYDQDPVMPLLDLSEADEEIDIDPEKMQRNFSLEDLGTPNICGGHLQRNFNRWNAVSASTRYIPNSLSFYEDDSEFASDHISFQIPNESFLDASDLAFVHIAGTACANKWELYQLKVKKCAFDGHNGTLSCAWRWRMGSFAAFPIL